jgi:carboxymethylenebutenolidase
MKIHIFTTLLYRLTFTLILFSQLFTPHTLICSLKPQHSCTPSPLKSFTKAATTSQFIQVHPLLIRVKKYTPKGAFIQLNDFGSPDIAYLSVPLQTPIGGLILIHEWWGLNDHIKQTADTYAQKGFVVIAVDLYNGKSTTDPDQAGKWMQSLNQNNAIKTIRAAERFLRESPRFRVRKTATLGWCMGGGLSLQAAIHIPTLDAAIIYYGPVETDPAHIRPIKAPILAHFANTDAWVSPESARSFIHNMHQAKKKIEVHFYDAEHAFANLSNPRHNPTLAALADQRTLAFLKNEFSKPLKSANPTSPSTKR